jgi:VIT1/CCC1 family predicted Fe2+/Mn2+ transporter
MDRDSVKVWLEHWHDESDAAYLYDVLATQESDPARRETYRQLADVERRHTAVWAKLLGDHGVTVPAAGAAPALRTRLLAWLGRRFGPGFLLPLLLRAEGREVKGYLALHQRSRGDDARAVSLTLAKESAQHAETLAGLTDGRHGPEPWHRAESGGFLRNVVYGFNDGLTANFGLVAGVVGAAVEPHIILISGVAGMIADALSMGSSGYLAAKSEQEVYAHEIAMEQDEIRIMPEVEEAELALLYEAKGMERARARHLAAEVMSQPARALEEQVREELKIGAAQSTPLREGWITGSATAVGALIPVAPFLLFEGRLAIWTAFVIAMLSHFAVGAARSVFTGRGIFKSGLDMFIVGVGVAAVGYVVGDVVAKLL